MNKRLSHLLIPGQDIHYEGDGLFFPSRELIDKLAQPKIEEQFIGGTSRFAAVQDEE